MPLLRKLREYALEASLGGVIERQPEARKGADGGHIVRDLPAVLLTWTKLHNVDDKTETLLAHPSQLFAIEALRKAGAL